MRFLSKISLAVPVGPRAQAVAAKILSHANRKG